MPALFTSLLLGLRQLLDGATFRILLKSLAVTLVAFVIVAVAGWYLLDWLFGWLGLKDELFYGAGPLREAASAILAVLGLWLTWRIVAMAVIQFFAEEIVLSVEVSHYPQAASMARELSLGEQAQNALGAAGRALLANVIAAPFALALLFTGIGTAALFWAVNAVLLGRELRDMVWLRYRREATERGPVGRGERFVLGGIVTAMLAIPFANFLAPVLGAASATHLVHRRQANLRAD